MKNEIKKHTKNAIIYLASSSILFSSCAGDLDFVVSRENFAEDKDSSIDLIPLDVYLSNGEIGYLKLIEDFAIEVLTNKRAAEEFSKNPQKILEKYGLENIDLDANEFQVIKALGDEEIQDCLESGDFARFWKLIIDKNLFESERSELLTSIENKLKSADSQLKLKMTTKIDGYQDSILVICVAAAIIYVVVGTIAAVELVAYVHAATHQYTATSGLHLRRLEMANEFYLNNMLDGNIMRIWKNNSKQSDSFYINDSQANAVSTILKDAEEQGIITKEMLDESVKYFSGITDKDE